MEREQIIKALELCAEWHSTDDCYKCPYYVPEGICECAEDDFLLKQAFALIKELIEDNDNQSKTISSLLETIKDIKSDTVRKMHTEIKDRCIKGGIYPAFVERTIENVAKEILESYNETEEDKHDHQNLHQDS